MSPTALQAIEDLTAARTRLERAEEAVNKLQAQKATKDRMLAEEKKLAEEEQKNHKAVMDSFLLMQEIKEKDLKVVREALVLIVDDQKAVATVFNQMDEKLELSKRSLEKILQKDKNVMGAVEALKASKQVTVAGEPKEKQEEYKAPSETEEKAEALDEVIRDLEEEIRWATDLNTELVTILFTAKDKVEELIRSSEMELAVEEVLEEGHGKHGTVYQQRQEYLQEIQQNEEKITAQSKALTEYAAALEAKVERLKKDKIQILAEPASVSSMFEDAKALVMTDLLSLLQPYDSGISIGNACSEERPLNVQLQEAESEYAAAKKEHDRLTNIVRADANLKGPEYNVTDEMIEDRKKIVNEYYNHLLKEIKKYGKVPTVVDEKLKKQGIKSGKEGEYTKVFDKLNIVYQLKTNLDSSFGNQAKYIALTTVLNRQDDLKKTNQDKLKEHRKPGGFFVKHFESKGQDFVNALEKLNTEEKKAAHKKSLKKKK